MSKYKDNSGIDNKNLKYDVEYYKNLSSYINLTIFVNI